MTVKDILTITGGNTRFYIQGTTEKRRNCSVSIWKS